MQHLQNLRVTSHLGFVYLIPVSTLFELSCGVNKSANEAIHLCMSNSLSLCMCPQVVSVNIEVALNVSWTICQMST